MKIVLLYHSSISDWNHGNAHFLRGGAGELAEHGRKTILARHTCAHRVDELRAIYRELTSP